MKTLNNTDELEWGKRNSLFSNKVYFLGKSLIHYFTNK